jgi:predicted short-subunit dehydrogenase-like oxidoreductase (DUF2520 family)
MRELERELISTPSPDAPIAMVGRGRVGRSLHAAAERAGIPARLVAGGEAADASGAIAVLLCVPDDAIPAVCTDLVTAVSPQLVGHVSGASTLDVLSPAAEAGARAFSLHPLQTFADGDTDVTDVPAAIAGSDDDAETFAAGIASALGMRPFAVPEERRAAYHAAASIASNFLIALEESAAELLQSAGVEDARELLAPLVLRTAANWTERGGEALTGPIARGDEATIERQREAVAEVAPELAAMYEALVARTRAVASPEVPA